MSQRPRHCPATTVSHAGVTMFSLTPSLAAKARALARGRYHVDFDDVDAYVLPVLRHRILLNFHAESERVDADEILRRLIEHMPPPKEA